MTSSVQCRRCSSPEKQTLVTLRLHQLRCTGRAAGEVEKMQVESKVLRIDGDQLVEVW